MEIINNKVSPNPDKGCDIIMKGGITSGIVYPKAIFELAKHYRFCSIGGTSAGAIASGLTAAAEFRRRNGSVEGFEKLDKLPENLGEKVNNETRLFSLFAPNDTTKKYYNTLIPFLYEKGNKRKLLYGLWAVLKSYPLVTILLILVFGLNHYFILTPGNCLINSSSSVISFLSMLVIIVITNAVLFLIKMNKDIKENNFGITKGLLSEKEKVKQNVVPLTEWLANLIDETAGKDNEHPLTFGDLTGCEKEKIIDLMMVTTNLNHGIPKTLPFKNKFKYDKPIYYFKEAEFKEYFPERIVTWMAANSEDKDGELISLPDADKLPVIVAVRMSLSFPVLISAVPLYVRTFAKDNPESFVKCWFSDGGICSNFPVHFFDSPLPSRPTFAINLKQMEKASADDGENISMPKDNREGLEYEWYKNDGSLISFIGSITKTMQNWNDNTQLRVPGFRDRICNILLTKEEGGLNLNMEEDFIMSISDRGTFAGKELTKRFYKNETEMNWDNHKWIRLRTTLSLLQKYLMEVEGAFDKQTVTGEMDYKELLNRGKDDAPASYPLDSEKQKKFIKDELDKIFAIVSKWKEYDTGEMFAGRTVPRPPPELRIKPKM